ncbi:GNAT family N-acetyltransferase [Pseudomonas schmalbachii]|uniref:GNAT family N-acetyltransferase n=1 Tax=Pseudomonas schmalbachii TaxID=2816993 RepID=A0ABS3TX87_9PSED|nr:GNAT family N-acetyltransferase [Pseudomonas schmalbachii]MBO3278268.1 GNAT family N-acetyltransferase [Pseudomonas schmalbachii]
MSENNVCRIIECPALTMDLCKELGAIYTSVGWGQEQDYGDEKVKNIFLGSSYCLIARRDGKTVGLLRALSDGHLTTWLAEIVVAPEHQGRGIGDSMLRKFLDKYSHTAIYIDALAGTESFFARHGVNARQKLIACSRREL